VNGWVVLGSMGATQYDIIFVLPAVIVDASQRWYVRIKTVALDGTLVPDGVEVFAGVWYLTGAGQGYVFGGPYDLSFIVKGTPGATSYNYRVLATTDTGFSILSNVLNVPNGPAVLSTTDYIQLFYGAGPGYIDFDIFREKGGVYTFVHSIRNSNDLMYNDVGAAGQSAAGWPSAPGNIPFAYAETSRAVIGTFGGVWVYSDFTLNVPPSYDKSTALQQYLRVGLTQPTATDRQVGFDRFWFSTSFNVWAPDVIRLSDGSTPTPSTAPTAGNQGGGGGISAPPPIPGSGGPNCVALDTPVKLERKGWRQFRNVRIGELRGDLLKGDLRAPYIALDKKLGTVGGFHRITTRNGITLRCSADHPLILDLKSKKRIRAASVVPGMRLAAWAKGRKVMTTVTHNEYVPLPLEVGTFMLRHQTGMCRDGHGLYIAGESAKKDRGLYMSNTKNPHERLDL
jgi:hypothetical protein